MIDIQNLCFSYTGKTPYLLNNINLNIPKGVYISVIGANGSAKTTLVKLILGLLKPVSGTVNVDKNKIGYVPQKLDTFNSAFPITVYEVLNSHRKALQSNNFSIPDSLKLVNMLEFQNKLLGNLSGGQQQRVLIGRALMGDPDLIILDEPSTGVDEANQNEIYKLLVHLNKYHDKTILSVEHNIQKALTYSTHILKVENGTTKLYTTNEYRALLRNEVC